MKTPVSFIAITFQLALWAGAVEPVVTPAFTPLPVGQVEPTGWLRDWAVSARNGITGDLDTRALFFRDGWKGVPIKSQGAQPDGLGWPLDSACWMDGAIRLGLVMHDQALIKKIRERLDPIVDAVNKAPQGTSFIHWKKGYQPHAKDYNGWEHAQMGRALTALYQGTGDQKVLDALVKVYAAYPSDMGILGVNYVDGCGASGINNLEPMLETYSHSGDRRILNTALKALDQPNPKKYIDEWARGQVVPGHMAMVYEYIRLPGIMYPWTGDKHMLDASLGVWKWLDENHMQPYGVASGEEFASGVGPFRKTETCDVSYMLSAAPLMYRILGNASWGDKIERAFFNAGAGTVSRDFQTMAYYQSPNRLNGTNLPVHDTFKKNDKGNYGPLGNPDVLCCVGTVNRILPNYIASMWMATRDNGLAATLYGPSTVTTRAGSGTPVTITSVTDYPFNESVTMKVEPEKATSFPLYLRIPAWCQSASIKVNGTPVPAACDGNGFAKLARTWAAGDRVELSLPMRPRIARGYETEVPAVNRKYYRLRGPEYFKPLRRPYASVYLGPMLFSLPIADIDPNTPVKDAKWQYALDTDADTATGITVERSPMPAHWDWPLKSPVTLKVPVQAFDWKPTDFQALPNAPIARSATTTAELVPYGCTKFRISMFPVTEQAWKGMPAPVAPDASVPVSNTPTVPIHAGAVRFIAYNVQFGCRSTPEEMGDMLKDWQPDVVALNETPGGDWAERVGKRCGMKYVHVGNFSSAGTMGILHADGSESNYSKSRDRAVKFVPNKYKAILSRTPLSEGKDIPMKGLGWRSTVVRAVTTVKGHEVAIYSVHLSGDRTAPKGTQAEYLANGVLAKDSVHDVVALGDFNNSLGPVMSVFDAADFSNLWQALNKDVSKEFTWSAIPGQPHLGVIDHILFNHRGTTQAVQGGIIEMAKPLSDHKPVWGDISFGVEKEDKNGEAGDNRSTLKSSVNEIRELKVE